MITKTRAWIYAVIAAWMLMAAPAVPTAQTSCADVAPGCFKGSFQGEDDHATPPEEATSVDISTTATGVATRLGRFSLSREVTGDLLDFSVKGSAEWIAANGDRIFTSVEGAASLDLPGGYLIVEETHTITGGTGRFTGAEGSFIVELFHTLAPSRIVNGIQTHDVFGSFEGTVQLTTGSAGTARTPTSWLPSSIPPRRLSCALARATIRAPAPREDSP